MPLIALALVEAIALLCGVAPRATEPGFADRRSIAAADVLVIYTGHNEFGGYHVRHPRTALLVREHPWLLDLRDALAQTRFYSLVSPPLQSGTLPAIETPDPDWDFEGTRQIALEACLRDLTATLDIARAEGVPVLLVTVVSNLSEYPFPRSQWDQVLERVRSSPSPPRWLAEYARGIELERAGDRAGSLEAFRRSRDGVAPALRAPTALNDALRELARGRPEVHLVDFERELDALGLEEGIGCNYYRNGGILRRRPPEPAQEPADRALRRPYAAGDAVPAHRTRLGATGAARVARVARERPPARRPPATLTRVQLSR